MLLIEPTGHQLVLRVVRVIVLCRLQSVLVRARVRALDRPAHHVLVKLLSLRRGRRICVFLR